MYVCRLLYQRYRTNFPRLHYCHVNVRSDQLISFYYETFLKMDGWILFHIVVVRNDMQRVRLRVNNDLKLSLLRKHIHTYMHIYNMN